MQVMFSEGNVGRHCQATFSEACHIGKRLLSFASSRKLRFTAQQKIAVYLTFIATRCGTHPGGGNKPDEWQMLIQVGLSQQLCHILLLHFQDEVSSHHWGRLYRQRKVVSDCFPMRNVFFTEKEGFSRAFVNKVTYSVQYGHSVSIYQESLTCYCLDHCVVIYTLCWKNKHKMMFSSSSVAFLHLHYTMVNNYTLYKTVKGVKGITFYLFFFVSQQNASIKMMLTAYNKGHLYASKSFKAFFKQPIPSTCIQNKTK